MEKQQTYHIPKTNPQNFYLFILVLKKGRKHTNPDSQIDALPVVLLVTSEYP
jgi:hypothetical protein